MKSEVFFWMWCISYHHSMMSHDFNDIDWVLALLSWLTFAVWRWWCFGFFHARLLTLFSSGCDAIRIIRDHCFQFVSWVLVLLSVWRVGFFGRHFSFLLAPAKIWLNFHFKCDAFRTTAVWSAIILMTLTEFELFFHTELLRFGR